MKTFKRLGSFLLAVVMVLTMTSVGMSTLASFTYSSVDVTADIIVPETIYRTPGGTSFQYYIAGALTGTTPSAAATTTGEIEFRLSKSATNIALTYSGATNVTLSTSSVQNANVFKATISGGTAAGDTITWTFNYTIDGLSFQAKAYTYVYTPSLGQAGAQAGYQYKTTIGNEPVVTAFAFMTGVHGVAGGTYRSNFTATSGLKMSPMVPGWTSDNNVPKNLGDDSGHLSNNDASTYFTQDSNGGMSVAYEREREGGGDYYVGDNTGYGYVTVDKSRYAGQPLNTLPNFKGGWYVFRSKDSSKKSEMSGFSAVEGGTLHISDTVDYTNGTNGEGYYGYAPSAASVAPSVTTMYTMQANFSMRRSNSSTATMHLKFGVQVRAVDKTALRAAVNTAIHNNYQSSQYSGVDDLQAKLKAAAQVLGNPNVTQDQIDSAASTLTSATNAMVRAQHTLTINYKLPAVEGFTYSYNGTNYTPANGYIVITETGAYDSGSTVVATAESFPGFTLDDEGSKTLTPGFTSTDQTLEFKYKPVATTINFVYGHDGFVTGADTTSKTISYGGTYGTLPAPKMDGYKFKGWKNNAGKTVDEDEICSQYGAPITLTAEWECAFAGGYGTADYPFQIATTKHLDQIDVLGNYSVTGTTADKFYIQTADLIYSQNAQTPIQDSEFAGIYNGQGKTIAVNSGVTVSGSTYGGIFGRVKNGTIYDVNVRIDGTISASTGTTYAGFVGIMNGGTLTNVQVISSGTVSGTNAGALAGSVSSATVSNCGVTINGGTLSGNAFIGKKSSVNMSNTWTLLNANKTAGASSNNKMIPRENISAATLTYNNGTARYTINAAAADGWSGVEYRTADDTVVLSGGAYTPSATANGLTYYICAVNTVNFRADVNGSLRDGNKTYTLREGQVVSGFDPVPALGYRYASYANGTNGTLSASAPFSFTMNTTGGDVVFKFAQNTYTVVFHTNDGTADDVFDRKTVSCTEQIQFPVKPARVGYDFKYWNANAQGTATAKYEAEKWADALTSTNGAVIDMYAIWERQTFTVTFDSNGGTLVDPVTKNYGESISLPGTGVGNDVVAKEGYKDLCWYQDSNKDVTWKPGTSRQITSNRTYHAVWTPIEYTIAFDPNGSGVTNMPENVTRTYDDPAYQIPSNVPVRSGYVFDGWSRTKVGGSVYGPLENLDARLTTQDGVTITMYAQWHEDSFTVTWKLDGGTLNNSANDIVTTVTFGGVYTVPQGTPVKSSYVFDGWYYGETHIVNGKTVDNPANITVTARWKNAQYTVSFAANGGAGSMDPILATCNTSFTLPSTAFTRLGYTFGGWNTAADGSGDSYADQATVSDNLATVQGVEVTLYAQWAPMSFTIKYDLNGINLSARDRLFSATSIEAGKTQNLRKYTETGKTKAGDSATYEFYGWAFTKDDADAMTIQYSNNAAFTLTAEVLETAQIDWTAAKPVITLYASWARNNTVTWDMNGGKIGGASTKTSIVPYGSAYVVPEGEIGRNRYDFDGWYTAASGGTKVDIEKPMLLSADQTLYAHWTLNGNLNSTYYIEYYKQNLDGTYPASIAADDKTNRDSGTAEIDTIVTATPPTFTGFTFDSSNSNNNVSGVVLDGDADENHVYLVLKLYYTRNSYTISFNSDGGNAVADITAKYDAPISAPADPVKTGYTFSKWIVASSGDNFSFTKMPAENVALKAVWTRNSYTISFDSDGGTAVASITALYNDAIEAPRAPGKLGFTFAGWITADGSAYTIPDKMPAQNVALKATWTRNSYTISFDTDGGSAVASITALYDAAITAPAAPTKTGFTFAGWIREDGTGYIVPGKMPAENIALKATWTRNSYTISFDTDGGSAVASITAAYDAAITAPAAPTKAGFTFGGWITADGSAYTIPAKMPAQNVALKATWTRNSYTISFDTDGGSAVANITAEFDAAITAPAAPTKTGFTFAGWIREDGTGYIVPGKMPAENIALKATWTRNSYTISFDTDGGSAVASITAAYDAAITAPAAPTKAGFTFGGWITADGSAYTIPAKMPAQNVALKATWTRNSYTISFDTDGGSAVANITAEFDAAITAPARPTKTGYIFGGWLRTDNGDAYIVPAKMPAENISLKAAWTPIVYTIVFNPNGGSGNMASMDDCAYDETYALLPNAFTKTGAQFAGWSLTAGGEKAFDDGASVSNLTTGNTVTLFAVWNNIPYTVTFNANGATNPESVPAAMEGKVYGEKINLPAGNGLQIESAETQQSREFLGWYSGEGENYAEYRAGAAFTMPAGDVTFYALWSANYYALNQLTATVKGYRDAQRLPANAANDPEYVVGGEMAKKLNSNGTYKWSDFDTAVLESAYSAATNADNHGLQQSQQARVDALTTALQGALDNLTLAEVDYTVSYACTHYEEGYYDDMNDAFYPACNASHSYSALLTTIERILETEDNMSIYTANSVEDLRDEVYGNGAGINGVVNDLADAALKRPAQAYLKEYVDALAKAYHSTLQLKDADYTNLDALITDYLPTINKIRVPLANLENYYTAESVGDLKTYINEIDRDLKIIHQSQLEKNGDIYEELKSYIDSLDPLDANYEDLFSLILTIPSGTPGFTLPASNVTNTVYSRWINWARENAGKLSTAVDMEFLNTRYTQSSVATLNSILNGIDWNLSVFDQNTINGVSNATSYSKLLSDAIAGLQERIYNLTFLYNDDSGRTEFQVIQRKYGDAILYPDAKPTRAGTDYVFKGWSLASDSLVPAGETDKVYSDMTFYAYWSPTSQEILELVAKEGSTTIINGDRKYIFGLKEEASATEVSSNYLEVIGNGHLEYGTNIVGTGTEIKLINDYTGEVADTFVAVVFGDLNGDGVINSTDMGIMKALVVGSMDNSFNSVYAFAADLNDDGDINNTDLTIIKSLVVGSSALNQASREQVAL